MAGIRAKERGIRPLDNTSVPPSRHFYKADVSDLKLSCLIVSEEAAL